MSFFKVTITGLDTIDEDFELESRKIEKAFPHALHYVGSEMIANLRKHIFEDWYQQYTPTLYQRRTDDPSLGQGLMSLDYMDAQIQGSQMQFIYEPSGDHANAAYHTRDGDKLIEFLQVGAEGIPPRPFWNFFVEEQKNSGIMEAFMRGMKPYEVIPEGGENDVVFEGNESMLQAGIGVFQSNHSDFSDDELPF